MRTIVVTFGEEGRMVWKSEFSQIGGVLAQWSDLRNFRLGLAMELLLGVWFRERKQ